MAQCLAEITDVARLNELPACCLSLSCVEDHESDLSTDLFSSYVPMACRKHGLQSIWAPGDNQSEETQKARKTRKARRWAGIHTRFVLDHLLQDNFSYP